MFAKNTTPIENKLNLTQNNLSELIDQLKGDELIHAPTFIIAELFSKCKEDDNYAQRFTNEQLAIFACKYRNFAEHLLANGTFDPKDDIDHLVQIGLRYRNLREQIKSYVPCSQDDPIECLTQRWLSNTLASYIEQTPDEKGEKSLVSYLVANNNLAALKLISKMANQNDLGPFPEESYDLLIQAVDANNKTALKLLIQCKADMGIQNSSEQEPEGTTALHYAIKEENWGVVRFLVKNKPLNKMENCDGEIVTAYNLAEAGYHKKQDGTHKKIMQELKMAKSYYIATKEWAHFIVPILIACQASYSPIKRETPLGKFLYNKTFDMNILNLVAKFIGSDYYELRNGMTPFIEEKPVLNSTVTIEEIPSPLEMPKDLNQDDWDDNAELDGAWASDDDETEKPNNTPKRK